MPRTLLRLYACAALLALAACTDATAPDARAEPELLRVYEVPASRLVAVQAALKSAGVNASRVPPDRLLVRAPVTLQASIRSSIEELAALVPEPEPQPTPQIPVRLTAWVVDASTDPAAPAAIEDPALAEVREALETVRAPLGISAFSLRERLLGVAGGSEAMFNTIAGDGSLNATLRNDAEGADGQISVRAGDMQVTSRTRLRYGEVVVLAQGSPREAAGSVVRLVLIRADRAG